MIDGTFIRNNVALKTVDSVLFVYQLDCEILLENYLCISVGLLPFFIKLANFRTGLLFIAQVTPNVPTHFSIISFFILISTKSIRN